MKEKKFTLYAYVDSSDLHDHDEALLAAFSSLIESRSWICGSPVLVNQQHPPDSSVGPDDVPDWELGLNLDIPAVGAETEGWFSDIEFIAEGLAEMCEPLGRTFALGIYDHTTGIVRDLFYVENDSPDLEYLRRIIGVEAPSP